MKTLFLGSYGFGNLGDELCLLDAIAHFGSDDAWAFSSSPEFTRRTTGLVNFVTDRPQNQALRPERVVLGGGGVGFWPSLRDSVHWMWDGMRLANAELHIYNIGVGRISEPSWLNDEIAKDVFRNLSSFTVRDHVSQWLVREWNFGVEPGITYYPEKKLPAERFNLPSALRGRLIGFSITGQKAMMDALHNNRDRVQRFVDGLGSFTAVPIVSTVQDNIEEDDIKGFIEFSRMFLGNRQIGFPEMLDRDWWSENLTPLRLKFVISNLDLLVSQRKHNIIHSIGCKVPFVGIFPDVDDSILRIMFSLRGDVPDGSSFLALRTGEF